MGWTPIRSFCDEHKIWFVIILQAQLKKLHPFQAILLFQLKYSFNFIQNRRIYWSHHPHKFEIFVGFCFKIWLRTAKMYLKRSSKCKILVLYPSFLTSILKGGGTNLYTEQLVFSEGFFPNPYIVFQFPKPIYWIYKVFKKSSFWRWLVLTLQMFLWALALIITPNCTSRELTRYLLKILFT